MPAFAFPAEAGTHLPTPEGWKAELALGGWLVTYRNKCPGAGIDPGHVRESGQETDPNGSPAASVAECDRVLRIHLPD